MSTNELNTIASGPELNFYSNDDSRSLFLDYESKSEGQGECYATIYGTLHMMLTQSQKNKNKVSYHSPSGNDASPSSASNENQGIKIP